MLEGYVFGSGMWMIKGIQILGMLVGLYLVAQTLLNFRRGNYGVRRTVFWVVLWSVMVALFFNPSLAGLALPLLTTQDVIMSVLVMSVLAAFVFITHLYQQMARVERAMTELVQNLAIHDYMKEAGAKIVRKPGEDDE